MVTSARLGIRGISCAVRCGPRSSLRSRNGAGLLERLAKAGIIVETEMQSAVLHDADHVDEGALVFVAEIGQVFREVRKIVADTDLEVLAQVAVYGD